MAHGDELFDWRAALRRSRRQRRLTQVEVSRRSGLSISAIKAYETGRRTPSRQALTAIVDALGLPREEANRIYGGAGYAVDFYTLFRGRYLFDLGEACRQVDDVRWPAFLSNQSIDVVHANPVFRRLLGVEPGGVPEDVGERNLFAGSALGRFASQMENFDELVTFMMGLAKGDPRRPQDLDHPAPWLRESVEAIQGAGAEVAGKFRALWEQAPPLPHRTTHQYHVEWRHGEGRLSFVGLLTTADIWDELSRNDWLPEDEATWAALERIHPGKALNS